MREGERVRENSACLSYLKSREDTGDEVEKGRRGKHGNVVSRCEYFTMRNRFMYDDRVQ